jgi:anti-anti-sigma regulatory factor
VDCDVSHLRTADLAVVDTLARAHLNARRRGIRLLFTNASPQLRELIAFTGLADVLLGRLEREPEEREEAVGVEEGVEADDPPV